MPRRITRNELDAMRELVAPPRITANDRRREEKLKLSAERMKKWPDTLEAQRKRKEEAYYDRLRAQEAERQRLDEEEDARRAKERKAKIEMAAKTIYRQTDKVKRLASAELLSDCLYVRDKQVELGKQIKKAEADWDAQFLVMERENAKRMEQRENAERDARLQQALEVQQVQHEQLEAVKQRKIDELREEEAEGQAILAAARAAEKEAAEDQRRKEQHARESQYAMVNANEELRKLKAEQAQKEAAEDAKIAAYAQAKADLKIRQDRQMKKIEEAKQRRRNELIEQGVRRLAELNEQQNNRLENEIAEARRLEDERFRILAEKRAAFARTIDESRQAQIEMRRRDREEQKQRDIDHARRWREYNSGAEELEQLEHEAEKRAARQHQQILLNQAQEKRERIIEDQRRQIFDARALVDQEQEDLDEFMALAAERIEAVKTAGKNPMPLIKCVNAITHGK